MNLAQGRVDENSRGFHLPKGGPDDRVGLTCITAERSGPREVYILEDRQTASVVGPAGEHGVSVLHWGRDEKGSSGKTSAIMMPAGGLNGMKPL